MSSAPELPIDAIFPAFNEAMAEHQQIIVHAPPGAGKSTRLPLWLLDRQRLPKADRVTDKIYLIQPRRLAAANVAGFLARQLNEPLGQSIGLRTRYQTVTGPKVRIEVMTEGVFIRLLQADPELAAISCVIFDEFHERSLALDMGLALSLQSQQVYRDDGDPLTIIVMSATLAADQLCAALPAAVLLSSAGRCYPVATHYQPLSQKDDLVMAIKALVLRLLQTEQANMLIFLPGMQEIRRLEAQLLASALPAALRVYALHSALPESQQRAAIAPPKAGECKLVLATNVAETSITIEGIAVVIDSGYAKVASFDNHKGMSRLLTQRISKASAEQRLGRAGRTAPGTCYRMWSKDSHHSLYDFDTPAILREDLAPFVLELACWGEDSLNELLLLDRPDEVTLQAARQLLQQLSALDAAGQITRQGKAMAATGLHPRLASMCLSAGQDLAEAVVLATLVTEPPLDKQLRQADFVAAAKRFVLTASAHKAKQPAAQRVLRQAKQLLKRIKPAAQLDIAALSIDSCAASLLLMAYPDRVAKQRAQGSDRYLLANGHELKLRAEDHLAGSPWLLVLDYGSAARAGHLPYVHSAIAVADSHIQALSKQQGQKSLSLNWDEAVQAFVARERHSLGAICLSERVISPDPQQLAAAVVAYVRSEGLAVLDDTAYRSLAARVRWFNQHSTEQLPVIDEPELLKQLDKWLLPYVTGVKTKADLKKIKLATIVQSGWAWSQQQLLAQFAPEALQLPTGNRHAIDYLRGDKPVLSVRIQECYGWQQTPTLGAGMAVLMELLSPARRPLQLTDDLAGFWAGSYHEVAKEMRGRYPRHFWPDDPANAKATTRTKKNMDK